MSIQALNWAYAVDGLPMAQKFALVTLANYADEFGVCWPEQDTLRADCACSERTMRDALAALEQARLIARKPRRRRDGSRRSDVYLLVGYAARRPIVGAEHHPILTAEDVAAMLETEDDNRQISPVDSADQPADFAASTGKICTTNRQNLPVTIKQEPPEEPSEEPPEEKEGAQARAIDPDFSKEGEGGSVPPASVLSALLRRVLVAVNHDPDGDLPHWWTGPGALTALERWRGFGLTDDQIVAFAAQTRKTDPTPPDGPKALDARMERWANDLRKRAGHSPVMTPDREAELRRATLAKYAEWVRQKSSMAANCIRKGVADDLMREGLCTPEDLKAALVPFDTSPGSVCARLFPEYRP
jgi:hypothetical protein